MRTKKTNKKKKERKKKLTLNDSKWENRYLQLKDFKRKYRHCNIPRNWLFDKSLARWVCHQRVIKNKLAPDRIEKLNKIGFVWNMFDLAWDNMYKQLKEFKDKYGHCEIRMVKGDYKGLVNWVDDQKKYRKRKMKKITPEKIAKLNKLGFNWNPKCTPWEVRYEELKEFKKKYGHCNVQNPRKNKTQLGYWVHTQRSKRHILPKYRKDKLNEIGFQWVLLERKKRKHA